MPQRAKLLDDLGWQSLTSRKRDVVDLVAMDRTYGQIVDRLCISRRTVESHLESMVYKLTVHCRRELARQGRFCEPGATTDDLRDGGRRSAESRANSVASTDAQKSVLADCKRQFLTARVAAGRKGGNSHLMAIRFGRGPPSRGHRIQSAETNNNQKTRACDPNDNSTLGADALKKGKGQQMTTMTKKASLRRLVVLLMACGIVGVIAAGPALAAGDTTGSGDGAGEFTSHTITGQIETPLCGLEHQQRFELTFVGDYTAVDAGTNAAATYNGPSQMVVTGNEQTRFGPTGTHGDDETCSPDSLGESGAVDIHASVSGQTTVNGVVSSVNCNGDGIYYRISSHVHIEFDGTCTVRTGALVVSNADAFHTVEGEQVPTSLATSMVEDPDTQQVVEQDVVGATYVVTPEDPGTP